MRACSNNTPEALPEVAQTSPTSQASVRDLLKLQNRLMTCIADGLRRAGFKPRRAGCMLYLKQHHPVTIWLTSYALDTRWWRITFFFDDSGRRGELTFHRDEIDRNLTAEFAEFLCNGSEWQWPLFAHWNDYPRYAWSELAAETIKSYWDIQKQPDADNAFRLPSAKNVPLPEEAGNPCQP